MVPAVGVEPTCDQPCLKRPRRPVPPRWESWSARGDSNPDLRGLNALPLPVGLRADGDHGRIRTANLQALDLPPLPRLGYMVIGPSGWTRTTTSPGKNRVCCVDTTKGMELMPSIELGRRSYQDRMLP